MHFFGSRLKLSFSCAMQAFESYLNAGISAFVVVPTTPGPDASGHTRDSNKRLYPAASIDVIRLQNPDDS
jgi:hypothetical protein